MKEARERPKVAVVVVSVVSLALLLASCTSGGNGTEETGGTASKPTGELRMLGWAGYADPSFVKPFEEQYDAKVTMTYVGAVDELFTKAKTQLGNYDIAFPDSSMVPRYVDNGLVQPLDDSRLPSLSNMLPYWQDQTYYTVDGKRYAVPFTGGATPIVYNATLVPDPEQSWGLLWDQQYAGKLGMLDDSNNSVVIAALYLGLPDPYNLSEAEFQQVKQALLEQAPLIRKYITGEDEEANLLASGEIVAAPEMEPGIAADLNESQSKYRFAELFPTEGALAWVDNAVLLTDAPNPDLAYAFMDYVLSTKVQSELVTKFSFLPIVDVTNDVSGEIADRVRAVGKYIDAMNLLQSPEDPETRVQIWNEVRAGG